MLWYFYLDVKVLVPPPPQFPQMTWYGSQNHAHFIQRENQQMNFASEWLKFSLFVSR